MISGPINGYLCESSIGWPGALYIFGVSGIIWSTTWVLYGFSTPRSHPSISLEERNYIESSLGRDNKTKVFLKKSILNSEIIWNFYSEFTYTMETHIAVNAILVCSGCDSWN